MLWKESKEGIIIAIRIVPKANTNEIIGWSEGQLRVRIAAVPEKGKANAALLAFLAKEFGVAKSNLILIAGGASRSKKILVKDSSVLEHRLFKEF